MKLDDNMKQRIDDYFNNTPKEEIQAAWDKTAHLDSIGPTVEEFLATTKIANELFKDSKPLEHEAILNKTMKRLSKTKPTLPNRK